ncbi:MAG: polymer-forming cytoskeletal protein [Planctomycetota bacterium]
MSPPRRGLHAEPSALSRSARCYHCGGEVRVGRRALTAMCPQCYRGIELADMTIRKPVVQPSMATCGTLVVLTKGSIEAEWILATEELIVHGMISGHTRCWGRVWLGPSARVRGSLRAPQVDIEAGAVIEGALIQIGAFCKSDLNATLDDEICAPEQIQRAISARP